MWNAPFFARLYCTAKEKLYLLNYYMSIAVNFHQKFCFQFCFRNRIPERFLPFSHFQTPCFPLRQKLISLKCDFVMLFLEQQFHFNFPLIRLHSTQLLATRPILFFLLRFDSIFSKKIISKLFVLPLFSRRSIPVNHCSVSLFI